MTCVPALFQAQAARVAKSDAELAKAVGFRVVVEALARSGAVVVGHNCFLDFLHTTAKFVGPIPEVRHPPPPFPLFLSFSMDALLLLPTLCITTGPSTHFHAVDG